ncbi:uncharacterized protein LOC113305736 [Papaver somniferum]|uniref:uncharacterized protein LOC113305736 n=1 Tax=Papaver somniferum TaxID=3469 RepID=UPI000E7022D7|nr:uncharacterized protein LOC113305736 [Papaver somniferum]
MPGRSETEAIFLARTLLDTYRAQQKYLHLLFMDLEKSYDKIPREVIWQALAKKNVTDKYIVLIQDMYEGARSSVRTSGGLSNEFPIKIGIHKGSALSPCIFALVIYQITKDIQGELPWTMLFADDVDLIGQSKSDVESRLDTWRKSLETKGFRLSRSKTEYLKGPFSTELTDDSDVLLAGGSGRCWNSNEIEARACREATRWGRGKDPNNLLFLNDNQSIINSMKNKFFALDWRSKAYILKAWEDKEFFADASTIV